jgi:RNA recognition motif-containing protein
MSVRIYVGNLPKDVERSALETVFADHAEEIVSVKLISDRKTGKCRGFGFVTVKTDEQADAIVEKFTGYAFEGEVIKIEKALPRSKGKSDEEGGSEVTSTPRRKAKGGSNNRNTGKVFSSGGTDAAQPDPRWAQDLAKLKELLAEQQATPTP